MYTLPKSYDDENSGVSGASEYGIASHPANRAPRSKRGAQLPSLNCRLRTVKARSIRQRSKIITVFRADYSPEAPKNGQLISQLASELFTPEYPLSFFVPSCETVFSRLSMAGLPRSRKERQEVFGSLIHIGKWPGFPSVHRAIAVQMF